MYEQDEIDRRLRGDMHQFTYGFSNFFQWFMGILATAATLLLGWLCVGMVELKTDVAVLKDRPPPVTQEAFNYRMEAVERRLTALESRK